MWGGRFVNKKKNGAALEIDSAISAVRNAQGMTTHYVAVMRDVTREIDLEKQLRQA